MPRWWPAHSLGKEWSREQLRHVAWKEGGDKMVTQVALSQSDWIGEVMWLSQCDWIGEIM